MRFDQWKTSFLRYGLYDDPLKSVANAVAVLKLYARHLQVSQSGAVDVISQINSTIDCLECFMKELAERWLMAEMARLRGEDDQEQD